VISFVCVYNAATDAWTGCQDLRISLINRNWATTR